MIKRKFWVTTIKYIKYKYVRQKPDERLLHEYLGEFGDRVLPFCYVLGVHLIPWRIKPSPVERNMNTDQYVSNFDDHLCYMVAQHFPYRPWIFKEDNAPCHMSARANAWKSINIINTLPRPAQSPDLNIMENVWKH